MPQTVTIFILDDLLLEGSEFFNVTLTSANSSTLMILRDSFTIIIEDEDSKLNCCSGSCVYKKCTQQNMHNTIYLFPSCSGITIGFYCPGWYYVDEDDGSVSVTVEILRGTPTRDVIVTLQTVDSSARGKALKYLIFLL